MIVEDMATTDVKEHFDGFFEDWKEFFQIMLVEEFRPAGTVAEFCSFVDKVELGLCLVVVSGYGKEENNPRNWFCWLRNLLEPKLSENSKRAAKQIRIAAEFVGKFLDPENSHVL